MAKIDKSLLILDSVIAGNGEGETYDSRAMLLVTAVYLCFMLSVPSTHIDLLLWYALYPIIASPLFGLRYASVFLQSLIVLPLVLLLGMFNPIIDHTPVATYGGHTITAGWLLFFGVIIRGLLSMQALLILIRSIGFMGMVRGMRRLGVPRIIVTQLMMIFRYMRVLIEEGITMKAAREARSFGRKALPVRAWGVLMGQLFLRSIDRAERVHKAMLARGFTGDIPLYDVRRSSWGWNSTLFLVAWCLLFLLLRFINLSLLFVR